MKERAVVEFLAQNPIEGDEPWNLEFSDETLGAIEIQGWRMHFDGALNKCGAGIGVILITSEGEVLPIAKKLEFSVTNNMAEYEACIFGLEVLIEIGVSEIEVMGGSMLVVHQATEEWDVKEERLRPYWQYLKIISQNFSRCTFIYLPREENQMADALATLASVWEGSKTATMKPLVVVNSKCHIVDLIHKDDHGIRNEKKMNFFRTHSLKRFGWSLLKEVFEPFSFPVFRVATPLLQNVYLTNAVVARHMSLAKTMVSHIGHSSCLLKATDSLLMNICLHAYAIGATICKHPFRL